MTETMYTVLHFLFLGGGGGDFISLHSFIISDEQLDVLQDIIKYQAHGKPKESFVKNKVKEIHH